MMKRWLAGILAMMLATAGVSAAEVTDSTKASEALIVRKHERKHSPEFDHMVVVKGDTVPNVVRERNFGRFDRGLYNYLFIPRGHWAFGLTASYGEIGTEDLQLLSILTNVDLAGKLYSVKPFVSYFVDHNQQVGLRLEYTRGTADLTSLSMDFDEDLSFQLRDVSYYSNSFAMSAFYRHYVGLGPSRRFAVFNEVDVKFGSGSSRFIRYYDDKPKDTRTNVTSASLNFSPGVCIFVQDNASFTVSFGVFGLNLRNEKQTTDGVPDGTRFTSGANFKFNLFNINFGLMIVI